MNIEQARDIFRCSRAEMVSEMNGVANVIREQGISVPIPNASFLHALALTDLMMRYTEREFLMVTGGHGDGFIGCLKDSFAGMLARLKENGGKAQVVVVDGPETNAFLDSFAKLFPNVLRWSKASTGGSPVAHFIVADGEMVRDEKPHPELSDESLASVIKANVYFHNRGIASVFRSRFERIWKSLKTLSP